MKLWFDPAATAPNGYIWCKTPLVLKAYLCGNWDSISEVNLASGEKEFSKSECDAIRILRWIEENSKQSVIWKSVNWHFDFHCVNETQKEALIEIINKNNWKLVEEGI